MISIVEIYDDVVKDNAFKDQNGPFNYATFNRISWRAQLRLIDWLTGNIKDEQQPLPPANQKNRDFLAPFLKRYETSVVGGSVDRPEDYYIWDNGYIIGGNTNQDCDEDDEIDDDLPYSEPCNTPIELLKTYAFNERCKTYISSLKPSSKKPIAKLIGKKFYFNPGDIGNIAIEYARYPQKAVIITKNDTVYNDQIPDEAATINFEWDEYARELLIWFITDTWANKIRENALKQFNAASKPTQP